MKNLVIVESGAKATKITEYLDKNFPEQQWEVAACLGHIRDLPDDESAVNPENWGDLSWEETQKGKKTIRELRKICKTINTVYLATDPDREGEAIAWHLTEALKLNPSQTKRIVFHEITKKAILNAVDNPRSLNTNLVNAQQARRVLDRLVGFEVSPVLWKKVKQGLSAGRVQSVAVG